MTAWNKLPLIELIPKRLVPNAIEIPITASEVPVMSRNYFVEVGNRGDF